MNNSKITAPVVYIIMLIIIMLLLSADSDAAKQIHF